LQASRLRPKVFGIVALLLRPPHGDGQRLQVFARMHLGQVQGGAPDLRVYDLLVAKIVTHRDDPSYAGSRRIGVSLIV
jgi:hypothetical protein